MSPAPALAGELCNILRPASGILFLLQDTAFILQDRPNRHRNRIYKVEAICKDPLYGAGVEMPRPAPHPGLPFVQIVEQPAGKALRFRYECEGRSAGSIPGVNSTPERKTYPTIEICGHKGQVVIVVSCVTREEPYKPHPHNLVGRERCENGVCTLKTTITEENPQVSFSNLGIQCVKRKDITDALKMREKLRVDPFKTGYNHRNQPQSIDLNAVRLCFQVFIPDERTGKIRQSLQPVVSDVIYDKKAMSDLAIMRLSQCSDYSTGGAEIILLCEKVTREDIAIVFFEQEGERVIWEEYANIVLVHKLTAIVFHVPPYRDRHVPHHVQVYLQLKRTSDNARSNAMLFEYIPKSQDPSYLKHKRQKTLSPTLQTYEDRFANDNIKAEPRDKTPPHQMSSPRQMFSPPYDEPMPETSYQWDMQPGIAMTGPSQMSYGQDMLQWNQNNYIQVPPNMQSVPPMANLHNMQSLSPNMQALSPNVHAISPNVQAMSPNVHAMSPNMQAMSPNVHAMSPNMQAMSPNVHAMGMGMVGRISPMHGGVSPSMGHISPNLMQQTVPQQELIETVGTDSTSIIGLLQDRGEGMPQLNSGELSGLSSLLDRGGPDLTDSLNRLSTSDLLQ